MQNPDICLTGEVRMRHAFRRPQRAMDPPRSREKRGTKENGDGKALNRLEVRANALHEATRDRAHPYGISSPVHNASVYGALINKHRMRPVLKL